MFDKDSLLSPLSGELKTKTTLYCQLPLVFKKNRDMYMYGWVCSPETITTLLIGYTPIQNVFGVKNIFLIKK